jgi:hypothetical protein
MALTQYTIPQLEDLIQRLPIVPSNFGIFEALLGLPYDIYRPIMDLLFAGSIFPEDLVDQPADLRSGSAIIADSQLASDGMAAAAFDISPAAVTARAVQIATTGQYPANLQTPGATAADTAAAEEIFSSSATLTVGGPATSAVVQRDQTAVGIASPDDTLDGAYAPSKSYGPISYTDLSYDSSLIVPNAIQLLRAGNYPAAQKAASAEFAAALNREVN